MEYKEVLENVRKIQGLTCKGCAECNGLACGNTMPGPGSKAPGNGANVNWKAWRSIKVNMDVIAPSTAVDMSVNLLGREFKLPIVTGPVGSIKWQYHPDSDVRDYNRAIILACEKAGAAASFGDGIDPAVLPDTIQFGAEHGGISMPVLNPYSDEEIMEKMDFCRKFDPFAMCVVIDSAGLPHLRAKNISAGTKTIEQLAKLKEHAGMPFVVKGVMSARSALKALEAGADDFNFDGDVFEITTGPNDLGTVRDALEAAGYSFLSAEVAYIPQTMTELTDEESITKMEKLIDMLEDNDDVQAVWHNWEMPDEE